MNIQTIKENNTTRLVATALFAALTLVATMVIRIPTITGGYIHPGDALVLLSGYFLGPIYGGIAAAIGSGLTDLLGGYMIYLPATFIIKGLTAMVSARVFESTRKKHADSKGEYLSLLIAGLLGELIMVLGYFIYEIFLLALSLEGAITLSALQTGLIVSFAGMLPNSIQGLFGILVSTIAFPLLKKGISRI